MSVHANFTLETIRCIQQSEDSGSEPYIWPFLATAAESGPASFDSFPTAAILADSRKIVGTSMKAGSSAPLIFPGNEVSHSFLDGQLGLKALLIVGLMEADDNRLQSMQAGYQAYLDELRLQLNLNLAELLTASPDEREGIIEAIKEAVRKKAYDAVKATLSPWEKFELGTWKDPDVYYGAGYGVWNPLELQSSGPFTLVITGVPGNHWEIDGVLTVTELEPNPCQPQVDGVASAEQAIEGLQLQVRHLQEMLRTATPQQKAAIVAAIELIRDDQMPAAEEDLRRAQFALRRCELMMDVHPNEDLPVG
jgi:hypothetical protein